MGMDAGTAGVATIDEIAHTALPPEHADTAIRISMALAFKHRRMFAAYPEVDCEEIASKGVEAICRQWYRYDPSKGAVSTLMTQQAHSAIQDFRRNLKSGKARMKRFLGQAEDEDVTCINPHDEEGPGETSLGRLLSEARTRARTQFKGARFRHGRKFYKIDQAIAVSTMMLHLRMGCRRTQALLCEREDLCEALGLRKISTLKGYRVPSYRAIHRGQTALRQFMASRAETVTGSEMSSRA